MNTRMDRSKLLIGVCRLGEAAQTEKHVKEIKECNIDIVTDTQGVTMYHNKELLDLFSKYGIGYIADSVVPFWFGSDRYAKGPMAEVYPIEVYEKAAKEFVDHPAVWALDAGDEPSALDFPHFRETVNYINKNFKNQFAYIDLYPNYAKVAENNDSETFSQLGATSYEEYIDKYCRTVDTDYICYDHYVYNFTATLKNYYANQEVISSACHKYGRSFWITLQANSHEDYKDVYTSANKMRFQAFSSLAYGAEIIFWGCYTDGAWWYNNVLTIDGEKTEQYEKLKQVNRELKKIGDKYMSYRNIATHYVGDFKEDLPESAKSFGKRIDIGPFLGFCEDNNKKVLVGEMVSRSYDGSSAVFVTTVDDYMDESPSTSYVRFEALHKDIEIVASDDGKVTLTKCEDGSYLLTMRSNTGALVIAR